MKKLLTEGMRVRATRSIAHPDKQGGMKAGDIAIVTKAWTGYNSFHESVAQTVDVLSPDGYMMHDLAIEGENPILEEAPPEAGKSRDQSPPHDNDAVVAVSLRDRFAIAALPMLQPLLIDKNSRRSIDTTIEAIESLSRYAYKIADAMLQSRLNNRPKS